MNPRWSVVARYRSSSFRPALPRPSRSITPWKRSSARRDVDGRARPLGVGQAAPGGRAVATGAEAQLAGAAVPPATARPRRARGRPVRRCGVQSAPARARAICARAAAPHRLRYLELREPSASWREAVAVGAGPLAGERARARPQRVHRAEERRELPAVAQFARRRRPSPRRARDERAAQAYFFVRRAAQKEPARRRQASLRRAWGRGGAALGSIVRRARSGRGSGGAARPSSGTRRPRRSCPPAGASGGRAPRDRSRRRRRGAS